MALAVLKLVVLLNKKTFLWVATKDELKDELNEILSNFKKNKDSTISNLRNFVINNGIKEKAEKFIEYNIDRSRKIIDTLDGDSGFLNYFSDLVLNREY